MNMLKVKARLEIRALAAALAAVALSGCVQRIDADRMLGGRIVHFGVTIIDPPAGGTDFTAYNIKTLGVGEGDGGFFGYQAREGIMAAPDKCHLAIIIRSDVETQNARQVLGMLKGEDVCVANFSRQE
jgi:hypothetical protein